MNDRSAPTGHKSHTIVTALAVALRHQSDCKRGPKLDSVTASLMAQLGLDLASAQALLSGIEALGRYVSASVEGGDALAEEDAAMRASRAVMRPALEARLQRRLDVLESKLPPTTCRECDTTALSKGRRSFGQQSMFGLVRLQRRYVRCSACGRGRFPSQDALLLGDERTTPRLSEVVTMLSTMLSYEAATKLCHELFGAEVSCHGAQRIVHRRAEARDTIVKTQGERSRLRDKAGHRRRPKRPDDCRTKIPRVTYIEADGVFAMIRRYLESSPDQEVTQGDASGASEASIADVGRRGGAGRRYKLEGREIKNAIIYSDDSCASLASRRGCLLRKTYVSVMGTPQDLALQLGPELLRQRADQARICVSISDGAVWIRNLIDDLPFKVIQILDLYHVKHRLHEAGKALYPDDEVAARRWSKLQAARIEAGDFDLAIEAVRTSKAPSSTGQVILSELLTYFTNNRDRMNYPHYRKLGLRVGSGAIESANHHVTGGRIRQQGMRWGAAGAAEMAGLRADLFNGRWRTRSRQVLALAG